MRSVELFVEIFVEELPAVPFLREFKHFEEKWKKILLDEEIVVCSEFFYTPRRMVIYAKDFPLKTQDKKQEVFGPPLEIAFENGDKTKNLKAAGEAFLKKNSLNKEALDFCHKNGKEVLFANILQEGKETKDLIASMVEKFLCSLHFGKTMRWGSVKESFIRPIRNVAIFLGDTFIQSSLYGLQNEPKTWVHRDYGFDAHQIENFKQYCSLLQRHGVILNQEHRKQSILDSILHLQKEHQVSIEIDEELLEEVVAITECPKVLFGSFDSKFLILPKEVIITSMKENQRYFAVYQDCEHQKLAHHFVMVSNSMSKDDLVILLGNQKVLKARLEDAMFFYQNDLKNGLEVAGLKELVFIDGAGSMWDKTNREAKIGKFLLEKYADKNLDLSLMLECIELSKADLLSQMVYEFSNLQGLMGGYYADAMQKDPQIVLGIREQYLPLGENSALPSSFFSSIVAMAHKLDNIFALFAIGKIPTGSKDPFALRRSANGILRIIFDQKLPFDVMSDLKKIYHEVGYQAPYQEKITEFFLERLEGLLEVNPSLLKSVLATKEFDVCKIRAKVNALQSSLMQDKEAFKSTFKRVANILKDNISQTHSIQEALLQESAEKNLFNAYRDIAQKDFVSYEEQMQALCALRPLLDAFFDGVMVHVENPQIRNNRIALIFGIYQQFLGIADIREVSF